jgi:hypothetical protein
VEIINAENGKPVGDIYELDFTKHREAVLNSSFAAQAVDVTFKPAHWERGAKSTTRSFEVMEYNNNWGAIINRYGQVESVKHVINDEDDAQLTEILGGFKRQYHKETTPANINDFVRDMVKARFHEYGYTQDDMVFTTPDEAHAAAKYKIPVYVLHSNNTAVLALNTKEVDDAVYDGHIFGMDAQSKQALNFFMAGNTLVNLPFTRDELKTVFQMALDKGKENIADKEERENIDKLIRVLDATLFVISTHDEITHEQDQAHDESEGFEP